ncbi:hypothetical protein P154DRAFT_568656 [Amniculicola lignicola CBS 123094]|uniref:Uncharacterized protein n=1 Tax=Amniculicola lignicola CBS 123094 TaxID=1392246 RepID=A0A6A5X4M8_9PLEO|nr:hypothetical protein P154DRAFT_568656 [Amniculicola lignicola CBS 123094]
MALSRPSTRRSHGIDTCATADRGDNSQIGGAATALHTVPAGPPSLPQRRLGRSWSVGYLTGEQVREAGQPHRQSTHCRRSVNGSLSGWTAADTAPGATSGTSRSQGTEHAALTAMLLVSRHCNCEP